MRGVTSWLWQFVWFRAFVIRYTQTTLPGHRWLAFETPLMRSLHEHFLSVGDQSMAESINAQMRFWDGNR